MRRVAHAINSRNRPFQCAGSRTRSIPGTGPPSTMDRLRPHGTAPAVAARCHFPQQRHRLPASVISGSWWDGGVVSSILATGNRSVAVAMRKTLQRNNPPPIIPGLSCGFGAWLWLWGMAGGDARGASENGRSVNFCHPPDMERPCQISSLVTPAHCFSARSFLSLRSAFERTQHRWWPSRLLRRLITLIFAGRHRIIVIRRELPRTNGAGRARRLAA